MVEQRGERFYIAGTDKWFSTRERALAHLSKRGSNVVTAPAPPPPVKRGGYPGDRGEPTSETYEEWNERTRPKPGEGLGVGLFVQGREDHGAMWEEDSAEIVGGPRVVRGDVQWLVDFGDGAQWVSAVHLRRWPDA